ncbi:hypothetical protein IHV25_09135 [Phaeovibrio sulfidiphilus]|uniref:Uncharacterized protein n=1 Tax=Phaeovibrio sulfidiphilus TaxID=1220600 RepID=A0A8J6YQ88_9PROT|nr:hypothetical protein [Phaeovibrio sulfidiphilus]MBE1237809.1 hypothetical protein [Phaeovibrio sulfidiphilus]
MSRPMRFFFAGTFVFALGLGALIIAMANDAATSASAGQVTRSASAR